MNFTLFGLVSEDIIFYNNIFLLLMIYWKLLISDGELVADECFPLNPLTESLRDVRNNVPEVGKIFDCRERTRDLTRRMQRETRVWNKTTKRSLANQICQNWGLCSYFSGDQGGLNNPKYLGKIFYGISSSLLPHLHISGSSVVI